MDRRRCLLVKLARAPPAPPPTEAGARACSPWAEGDTGGRNNTLGRLALRALLSLCLRTLPALAFRTLGRAAATVVAVVEVVPTEALALVDGAAAAPPSPPCTTLGGASMLRLLVWISSTVTSDAPSATAAVALVVANNRTPFTLSHSASKGSPCRALGRKRVFFRVKAMPFTSIITRRPRRILLLVLLCE